MTAPGDALLAVAALQRAMASRDYAGAARLITMRSTLDGMGQLAGYASAAWQSEAERAYRESVAAWQAEYRASLQRQQKRDVTAFVALVAGVLRDAERDELERQTGRLADGWVADPLSAEQAAANRTRLLEALDEHARAVKAAEWPTPKRAA